MRVSAALLVLVATAQLRAAPGETLDGHEGVVTALAFSPDGDRLISVGEDGRALVWDVKTRKVVHRSVQKDEKLYAVAWRPDGAQFATAGESGVVRVWEVGGDKPVAEHKGHMGPVAALAYSPDGKVLASGGYMRTIRFWSVGGDVKTEESFRIQDLDGRVTSLAFADGGKALVVGTAELTELRINDKPSNRYGEGGLVRVYDALSRDRELVRKLDLRGSQVAVAGDRVLAVGLVAAWKEVEEDGKPWLHTDGTPVLSVADLKTGKTIATAAGAGLSAAWSKDGAAVVCGGYCYRHYPGNIMLGSGEGKSGGAAVATGLGKGDKVTTLAIDPRERGPNNVFGGGWPPLALRDPITLKKGVAIDQKEVECLAISPDGKLIAVGELNGLIRLHPNPETK
jgi:WD40 repeat protein